MKKDETILASLIAAVICMALTIVFMLGGNSKGLVISIEAPVAQGVTQATAVPTAPPTTQSTTAATTQAVTETAAAGQNNSASQNEGTTAASQSATTQAPSTTAAAQENALPSTPAEILARYTLVMDKAKADGPAHKKVEYQAIPEDKVNFEGGVFNKILPLASLFFTTEEDARANPELREKGGDMYWFPIYKVQKGCLLTDVSKIKDAKCEKLPDGNVKITLVLNDELNPEPPAEGATSCDNAVGSVFTPIMMADVHNTLKNDAAVKFVVKDVDFELTYYDCTAELVFNPETNEIVSLDQYMHILINIKSGKVVGMNAVGTAVLDNYLYFSDFQY